MVIPIGSPIVIELLQVTLDDTINIPGLPYNLITLLMRIMVVQLGLLI